MSLRRYILPMALLLGLFLLRATPARAQGVNPPSSTYRITFAELGYNEVMLESVNNSIAEYVLRLPEGWVLNEGSFLDLDVSYMYESLALTENLSSPTFFGDIVIAIDGQIQETYAIRQAGLEHIHLQIDLPLELFNDAARTRHTIEISFQAGHLCRVPHQAYLVIHSSSFFSLSYEQLPVSVDLARYPNPFYQNAFEADQVYFVLPTQFSQMILSGATAIAAKLGDLTYNNMVISGTTDLDMLEHLQVFTSEQTLQEHLIIVGEPETNEMILRLNQLDALPVPLKERELVLSSRGLVTTAPGSTLTYTLRITNTTAETLSSTTLLDTFPAFAHVLRCTPACSSTNTHEVSWTLPSLGSGEALSYVLALRLGEVLTDSMLENTITLFDAASVPLNVNTLTTTVTALASQDLQFKSSVSPDDGYFFWTGVRAVPENDGIIQELVSPWNQARAILLVTGLNDQAVYKACQAMSTESRFPGMEGAFALVQDIRPELTTDTLITQVTDLTFADLGYEDREIQAFSQDISYYFDIPADWQMTEEFFLDLYFSHSPLLNYDLSYFTILFNQEMVATVTLNDETTTNGMFRVALPPSQVQRGEGNRITIRSVLEPSERCANLDVWLLVKNSSFLHLGHTQRSDYQIDLDFYPNLFTQRRDLGNVLFMLPSNPRIAEWEMTLRLAAALGREASASKLTPMVSLGMDAFQALLGDYHLIVVGRPSRNPVLQYVNDKLPQPFQLDSDAIVQQIDEVIFRWPSDFSLGLVQLLISPWNDEKTLMAVTGTTDTGVEQAATVVVEQPWRLGGNLVLIREDRVSVMDTRSIASAKTAISVTNIVSEITPAMIVTVTVPVTPSITDRESPATSMAQTPTLTSPNPEPGDTPFWIVPLVVGTVLIIVVIFAIAFWQTRQRE